MKKNKLGFAFMAFMVLVILSLGTVMGMKIEDDIAENGLCFSPSITVNGEVNDYEFCLIQPPAEENAN